MANNFSRSIKQDAVYGVTTTTAKTFYGDRVDMANFEGALFTALFKSTAGSSGTVAFTIVGSNSTATADGSLTALNGATCTVSKSTSATDKRVASIDVFRPQYRYLKAKFVKQAGILCNAVLCQKYGERVESAAASTTYAAATAAGAKVLAVEST